MFNHLLIVNASSTVGTVVKGSFDNCINFSLVIFSDRSIDEVDGNVNNFDFNSKAQISST